MNNLMREKGKFSSLRIFLFGALNGALVSAVVYPVFRVMNIYTLGKYQEALAKTEEIYQKTGTQICLLDPLAHPKWFLIVSLHILFFIIASFIAHRYFKGRTRSIFALWQFISFIFIAELGLLFLVTSATEFGISGHSIDWSLVWQWGALVYLALVVATNIIYGSILHILAAFSIRSEPPLAL